MHVPISSYSSAIMRQALDEHCLDFDIGVGSMLRSAVTKRIQFLFGSGVVSVQGLSDALQADREM